jgi:hypothetical protein
MAGPTTRSVLLKGVPTRHRVSATDSPSAHAAAIRNAEILGGVVRTVVMATRPLNTTLAYDPKAKEYDTFCDHVYKAKSPSTRYTVGTEKVFLFLFYQAFRNKYKRGGISKGEPHGFDTGDYDTVVAQWARYNSCFESGEIEDIPDPSNPCHFDSLNTYKTVLQNVWSDQASQGANGLTWELIFTRKCKELMNLVKERRRRIKRKLYAEKVDHEFTPFTSMAQVGNIEQAFWDHGKTVRESLPGLRNRCIFLLCYSGLLRSESMFLGELSDMLCIEYQRSRDSDPFFIMVMQIATGKSSCCLVLLSPFLNSLTALLIVVLCAEPQEKRSSIARNSLGGRCVTKTFDVARSVLLPSICSFVFTNRGRWMMESALTLPITRNGTMSRF